jgi:peptidoglycan/LPS O-acetylase OafA/YrhL
MLTMKILAQGNLQEDHLHTLLISLLRGLAAVEVAAAHVRVQVYPGYSLVTDPGLSFKALVFLTGFAHLAVVVFFLLSGWLVGGSLLNKSGRENAIKSYAIDRMTRLWIVLIPTFLLMIFFAVVEGRFNVNAGVVPVEDYSATAFFGNLLGLQGIFVPNFGGNFPLWSLSNETWYYALFPLLVVACSTSSVGRRFGAISGIAAISYFTNGPILLYFSIWLMGAGCSRIRLDASPFVRWTFFAGFLASAVYFRMSGKVDDLDVDSFVQDYIFSVFFLLFLASTQFKLVSGSRVLTSMRRAGKFFSDFAFTLYVLHIPLLGLIVFLSPHLSNNRLSANSPAHMTIYFAILAGIVAAAYLFHLLFEANTYRVRNYIKRVLIVRKKSAMST